MPEIDPQLRNRNTNGAAAPSGGRTDVRSDQNRGDADVLSKEPRRSGRGAELAVRMLWLVLGFALGVSVGMIWSASVISGS